MIAALLALLLQVGSAGPLSLQAAATGAPDVVLPSATLGIPLYTVKVLPGAAAVTVRAPGAELVDGAKTFAVSAGGAVTFRAQNGGWYVVGAYSTAVPGSGTPAAAVVSEITFGQASAVGVSTDYARADHTHGTPTITDADVNGANEADELVLAGDVDGTANANDIDEASVEAELETVIDLPDLQGILTVAKGGTGAAPGADDQLLVADSAVAATWRSVGVCTGAGKALTYDTATNTFGCNTIGSGSANAVSTTVAVTAEGMNYSIPGISAAWVTGTMSVVCAPIVGASTTVTHETLSASGMQVTVGGVSAGIGFDLYVTNPYGLEGTVDIRCIGV